MQCLYPIRARGTDLTFIYIKGASTNKVWRPLYYAILVSKIRALWCLEAGLPPTYSPTSCPLDLSDLDHTVNMSLFSLKIGPGIVYLTFNTIFGKGAYLQSITPIEPLVQQMIQQVHMNWWVPPLFAKFLIWAEAIMVGDLVTFTLWYGIGYTS